jgi:hypothetical protein
MGTQMAWWCFLDKTTPNIVDQGKRAKWHDDAQGDTRHNARGDAHGTTLEATLGMLLCKAKMETRRETTAKMRTGFLILMATHDLQNLPAWLTLEKLRCVCNPCHPTWDLPRISDRDAC